MSVSLLVRCCTAAVLQLPLPHSSTVLCLSSNAINTSFENLILSQVLGASTTQKRGLMHVPYVHTPTPLVDHRDESAPGVVVVRVLLHVLGEVYDLLCEDGHHDPGRPRVLVVLAPLELGGLPGQLVEVCLKRGHGERETEGCVQNAAEQPHVYIYCTPEKKRRARSRNLGRERRQETHHD